MIAVKGTIKGNTVVLENEDIKVYDGKDVIITILDYPYQQSINSKINLDEFVIPTERGKNADQYIKELREDDRI